MSYVEEQLGEGEQIVFQTKLHPIIFANPSVVLVLALASFAVEATLGAVLTMIALFWVLGAWIRYTSSEFAVTDRRVIIKTGFISRKTIETQLTKVEGAQVSQGILGRILGFGEVTVTGTGGTHEPFKRIRHPMEFRKHVQEGSTASHVKAAQEHLQATQVGGGATSAEPREDDVVTRLERLAQLRESGALTQDEFEREKGKLLG